MKRKASPVDVLLLIILCNLMGYAAYAQNRGAYAAGINYPAGPPVSPTNTGYYLGGINPVQIQMGDFNGDGKADVAVAAFCSYGNLPGCSLAGSTLAVYLSNGDGSYQSPILSTGNLPPYIRSIVLGDFNGDGRLDAAVAADCLNSQDCSGGTVFIFLGNGDGTLTQSSQYALNGFVLSSNTLAVGDFNHDGDLDLVAGLGCYNGGCSTGSVTVFLGNGDGTLGTPTPTMTIGNSALLPVVSDFDKDGNQDIVAGCAYAPGDTSHSSLTLLLGNGNGSFKPAAESTLTFGGLSAMISLDVNSDGNPDLAVTTYPASLQILNGNGNGSFQPPVASISGLNDQVTDITGIATADFNHDGSPDLMLSGSLNGANAVQMFLNSGTGTFAGGSTYNIGGWNYASIIAQDVNGDGNADVLMASYCSEDAGRDNHCPDGTVSVLLGNGDGTMQAGNVLAQSYASNQSNATITADFNGDGIPDIVQTIFSAAPNQGGVVVYLGTGKGTYGTPNVYLTGSPTSFWVAAGDYNGDGKLDLVVANLCSDTSCSQGGVAVLLGNGDGSFQTATVYGAGSQYSLVLATGDFNGDGKLDVAVMNQVAPSSISILLGNGDGTLQPGIVTNTSTSISSNYSLATADLNGDGKTDVALVSLSADQTTGLIGIYLSNGDGTLSQAGTPYPSGGTADGAGIGFNGLSIAIGDVNNDGKADIVAANGCQHSDSNCGYGSLAVLLGNGDGTFQAGSLLTVPDGNLFSLLLADVDGDGVLDAISSNLTGVAVFHGSSNGTFQKPIVYAGVPTGGQNMSMALADLNIVQTGLSGGLTDVIVNRAGTYLVTTSSSNPSPANQSLTLTTNISVSYLVGTAPTGSISYFDGPNDLGSVPLLAGSASMELSGLSQGIHTITAYYSGDANFNAHYGTQLLEAITPGILSSIKLTPSSLAFGSQVLGTSSPAKAVKLTNTGTGPLSISNVAIVGTAAADFSQTNTCGSGVAASSSCMFNVTFTPNAKGSLTASLVITDNSAGSPHMVPLKGTGLVSLAISPAQLAFGNEGVGDPSAAKILTLKNNSSSAATFTGMSISGPNAADFSQSSTTCGSSLAAKTSCEVSFIFSPSVNASETAVLSVMDSTSGSPQTIAFSGTGVKPVSLSVSKLAFGKQVVSTTSAAKIVTVKNNNSIPLTIESINITPTPGDFLESTTTCGVSIAAHSSCTISITYAPSAVGAETASLNISDDAGSSPQTVSLSGTGLAAISLTPSSISFGSQKVGTTSAAKTLTITNNLPTAVALTGYHFTGSNVGDFVQSATTCGASLAPSASCMQSIEFGPSATGVRSATYNLIDSANGSPQSTSLMGTGK